MSTTCNDVGTCLQVENSWSYTWTMSTTCNVVGTCLQLENNIYEKQRCYFSKYHFFVIWENVDPCDLTTWLISHVIMSAGYFNSMGKGQSDNTKTTKVVVMIWLQYVIVEFG